jgi:hypothetical protein
MKLISTTLCFAAICAVGLGAQSSETKSKTKVEVKDGKEMTVIGCVERTPGGGYMLTDAAGGTRYALVGDQDFAKHLGHRVEVSGRVADRSKGRVKVKTKVKTEVEHGKDRETEATTEAKGDLGGLSYVGVKSLKMISSSCL